MVVNLQIYDDISVQSITPSKQWNDTMKCSY